MSLRQWILPLLCVGGVLSAQSTGDLNTLITNASHYASHGLGGTRDAQALELCKVIGDRGSTPDTLMLRSVDVLHWNFLYRVKTAPGEAGAPEAEAKDLPAPAPKPHRSVSTECTNGIFGGFKYSANLITGVKPLEFTWIGLSLQDAIAQLNALGFTQGFRKVTLMRPANPNLPDDYVYVFDCPWERAQVALSTQDGTLKWRINY